MAETKDSIEHEIAGYSVVSNDDGTESLVFTRADGSVVEFICPKTPPGEIGKLIVGQTVRPADS